jgi:hypothetical protein
MTREEIHAASAVGNEIAQRLAPMEPPDGVGEESRDAHSLDGEARKVRANDAVRYQQRVQRQLAE